MDNPRVQSLIARNDEGIPVIVGANTKVAQLVSFVRARDKALENVPGTRSVGQDLRRAIQEADISEETLDLMEEQVEARRLDPVEPVRL